MSEFVQANVSEAKAREIIDALRYGDEVEIKGKDVDGEKVLVYVEAEEAVLDD